MGVSVSFCSIDSVAKSLSILMDLQSPQATLEPIQEYSDVAFNRFAEGYQIRAIDGTMQANCFPESVASTRCHHHLTTRSCF